MSEGDTQQRKGGTSIDDMPLFTMAAHELKSPLALIRQLAASMEDDAMSPAQRRLIAKRIELTSQRALRLTTNLTQSQTLEPTLFPLEPLNVMTLCQSVVGEMAPLYEAKGKTLRVVRRNTSPLAVGNRDLVDKIVLQFADNALHYAGKEPVELSVRTNKAGRVRVSVRDYGPAVTADAIVQSKSRKIVTPRRPQSSGLGLLICRQFADVMNAKIGVIRHKDGASFYLDLQGSTQLSLV